jgi:hypothetical protein
MLHDELHDHRAFAKVKKPEGDSAGNAGALFLEEKAVMSIYDGPVPHVSLHKLKLTSRVGHVITLITMEYLR